jgi:hypothetical protein
MHNPLVRQGATRSPKIRLSSLLAQLGSNPKTTTSKMRCVVRIAAPVKVVLILLIPSFSFITNVTAYSTGAGSCDGGQAAVGSLHLESSNSSLLTRITFEEAGLGFFMNDQWIDVESVKPVNANDDTTLLHNIRVGGLYDFVVGLVDDQVENEGSYEPFKGALIRVSQGDETSLANFISESSFSSSSKPLRWSHCSRSDAFRQFSQNVTRRSIRYIQFQRYYDRHYGRIYQQ